MARESGRQIWVHNAEIVVCSGSRTIEKQQPCTLKILDMGDLVHQSVVLHSAHSLGVPMAYTRFGSLVLMREALGHHTTQWRQDR